MPHWEMVDLPQFIIILVSLQNKSSMLLNFSTIFFVPSHKIKTSSTNKKWVMLHARPMHILLKLLWFVVSFISLFRPLSIRRKMRGDKGKTYLKSLPGLSNMDATPLIKIAKDTEVMKLITLTTSWWKKLKWISIIIR